MSTIPRRELFAKPPTGDPPGAPIADVLAFNPRPLLTRVAHLRFAAWTITAIMRHWRPGDAGRCRLCPRCRAYDDGCLLVVGREVSREEAPTFSSVGMVRVPSMGGGAAC